MNRLSRTLIVPCLSLFGTLFVPLSGFSMNRLFADEMKLQTQTACEGKPLRYWLYVPDDMAQKTKSSAADKTFPLVLFLHGGGEGGDDPQLVKKNGLPRLIASGKSYPFILVAPQNPSETQHWDDQQLIALLDQIQSELPVDPHRVYLTGLSRGGYGAWRLGIQNPDRFAAIVPICGGGLLPYVKRLKDVPIWVFHGAKDPVIPISESQRLVDALQAAGSDVKFTIYPNAGHNAWKETYENPELYRWMLEQKQTPQSNE